MPNQRDPNKKQLTLAIDKKVIERIKLVCNELNMNCTDFFRMSVEKELKVQEEKLQLLRIEKTLHD